jgi:hypothetical protein
VRYKLGRSGQMGKKEDVGTDGKQAWTKQAEMRDRIRGCKQKWKKSLKNMNTDVREDWKM